MGASIITAPPTTTPPSSNGTVTLAPSTAANTQVISSVPQDVSSSVAPTPSPLDWLKGELDHLGSQPTRTAWFTMEFSMGKDGTKARKHEWGVNGRTWGGTGIGKTAAGVESAYELNPTTGAWESTKVTAAQDKMGKQIGLLSRLDKSLAPLREAWNLDKYSPDVLDNLQGDRQTFIDPAGGQSTVLRRTMPSTGPEEMWSVLMPAFQPGGCLVPSVLSSLPAMFSAPPAPSLPASSSAPSVSAPTTTPMILGAA